MRETARQLANDTRTRRAAERAKKRRRRANNARMTREHARDNVRAT
jgi:hypothetical protein